MRVFYIAGNYDGCYYVRCLLPLQSNGWDGAKTSLEGKRMGYEEMFDACMKSDIIVFQRPDSPDKTEAIKLLKKAGKKIVFDNDDTYRPDSGFPKLNEAKNQKGVKIINDELYKNIKQSDLVTTTTEVLADEYRELSDNVVVLKNCIDPFDWDEPKRNNGDKVRVGITGSVAYNDYKLIKGYLKELSDRDDVQLVMFALSKLGKSDDTDNAFTKSYKAMYKEAFDFMDTLNIEWQPQVHIQEYMKTLNDLELDIMLIPRDETYFNKCKSNLKYLEASTLEIPVVASSFSDGLSPYDKDIRGNNGYLARTEADFKKYTDILINDKKLRRAIGKEANKYVLENYNIEKEGYQWVEAYNKLITN